MVFHKSIVNWSGVHVFSVYVHSTICDTYLVYLKYHYLFGVMVFQISIVNWSGGICILSICAFCYI